jgi:hypothetical protein
VDGDRNDALLHRLEQTAFDYFRETELDHGLVADTDRPDAPISIAVIGFALAAYPVAVERGWMRRSEAIARTLATLRFFHASAQSSARDATGHMGFYYHFLDRKTGRRTWRCELSMIDTAFLVGGALSAATYFSGDREIVELADVIYRRVDWNWARNECPTIAHGWKPECGFLHYGWEGYSEAMLLYILALGSPTHPIPEGGHASWTTTYQWENLYGHDLLYAGPLFIHQFAHAWIDFEGIRDEFMREKKSDYFENSKRATYVQREYARLNPRERVGYGADAWGISAGDGPPPRGYVARGVPYGPDDGTLAPPTVVGSLPFAPDIAFPALRKLVEQFGPRLPNGINPTLGWVSERSFGLDQGLVVLMIENHRSRLLWRLMRDCPHVVKGLRRAGFTGGWLSHA